MVNVEISNGLVTFEIKNNGINDLKNFYTTEYFNFMNINYEISVSTSTSGGYINRFLNVPFKQFTDYAKDSIKIKSKSSTELLKQLDKSVTNNVTNTIQGDPNKIVRNEIILIKIRIFLFFFENLSLIVFH